MPELPEIGEEMDHARSILSPWHNIRGHQCNGCMFVGQLSQGDQLFIKWWQRKRAENKYPEIFWHTCTSAYRACKEDAKKIDEPPLQISTGRQ